MQARQQAKALTAAPRVTTLPTQDADVGRAEVADQAGDATKAATPSSSAPKPIISTAVTTVK